MGALFSEACGFRIYSTVKEDRVGIIDVVPTGPMPER